MAWFFRVLLIGGLFCLRVLNGACPSSLPPLPDLPIPFVPPPPVETCPIHVPTMVSGYMPITIANNSGLPASEVFIAVLVNSNKQYLSFSGGAQKLGAITEFTPISYFSETKYSHPLSFFETSPGIYTFYIPNDGNTGVPSSSVMQSSRILITLKEPLTYFINHEGNLNVPSDLIATSDNYYILNDKVEFDLGSNAKNRLNMNLTGVDFFGLPLLVQASYKFLFGTTLTEACAKTGMPSHVTFNDVFTQYESNLTSLLPPFDTHWSEIVAKYTNPVSAGGDVSYLRIFAPATAMGSTQKQTNPTKVFFPANYFLSSISDPDTCSWFNAVWKGKTKAGKEAFYQNRKPTAYLVLDATTVNGIATAKGYELVDGSFRFVVQGGPDNGRTVIFPVPTTTMAFLTGAITDYEPAIGGSASSDTKKQLLKVFATSIISGIFPLDCKPDQITITNDYVQAHSSDYFENNSTLQGLLTGATEATSCPCVDNVPWYDFYSRTLLTIGTPNLFYTSAYSDFLGSDGTIVITGLSTVNAKANVNIAIGDCTTDVHFPNPYDDTTVYTLTVGIPAQTTVEFSTSESGPFGALPATVKGDEFYLRVTYHEGVYSGMTFVTRIAPLAELFHPILPGEGVVKTTGTKTNVSIGASPT